MLSTKSSHITNYTGNQLKNVYNVSRHDTIRVYFKFCGFSKIVKNVVLLISKNNKFFILNIFFYFFYFFM